MRLLEQFKYAVRYGSGKAYQILASHPELPVDDFLVESALHNYDLDPQSSGHRALYMDELLELRPNYRKLLNHIARRFENDETLSDWDAVQVYELLCGNSTPTKNMLRIVHERFTRKFAAESTFGVESISDNERKNGVLFVARTIGQKLLNDPDYWLDDWIPAHWSEAEYDFEWRKYLEQHLAEPNIAAFLHACDEIAQNQKSSRKSVSIPSRTWLDQMLQDGIYQRIIRLQLSPEDIAQIRLQFQTEDNPERLKILCRALTVTRGIDSEMVDKLCNLCLSQEATLRELALDALSLLSDCRVRKLAENSLQKNPAAWEFLALLVSSWQNSDERFVRPLFRKFHCPHVRHGIIMTLLEVKTLSQEMLIFLYRHCLCGHCRVDLIKMLSEQYGISPELASELAHESQLEIRKLINSEAKP